MGFIYSEPKSTRGVRPLKEGEDSSTVRLLEYIAQYGSTKGAGIALGGGGAGMPMPLRRLTLGGYIRSTEDGGYELTEKGLEYLGSTGPFYERVGVEKAPDEESSLTERIDSVVDEANRLFSEGGIEAARSKWDEYYDLERRRSEIRRGWKIVGLGS